MKHLFLLGLAAALLTSCQQNTAKEQSSEVATSAVSTVASPDAPILTFEKTSHDFGKLKQGLSTAYSFKFKNTGKTPLIIIDATATCGCTIPETPKDPVKPGAEGTIKVIFNSAGKMGIQDKIITVTSNANPAVSEVHLIGEVIQP